MPSTPDELLAAILGVPARDVREAEEKFDAGRRYAETLPDAQLAALVQRALAVRDEPTALAAAYEAFRRGDGPAMACYGTLRPEKLPLIERWSVLVYGEAGA